MTSPFGTATQSSSPALNPFAPKPTNGASNPFATLKSTDASGTQQSQQNGGLGGFGALGGQSAKATTGFGGFGAASSNDAKRMTFGSIQENDADSSDSGLSNGKKRKGGLKKGLNGDIPATKRATSTGPTIDASRPASAAKPAAGTTVAFPPPAIPDSNDPHAQKVYAQLRKDNITPPKWPSDPGNPKNYNKVSKFRDDYEAYRVRVRKSLTKAGVIDDPAKRRALKDAIEFRGISEEMCPEFEKIQRINELDVPGAEKDPESTFAARTRMVKKLARSAAGQEAPLPMDVRSIAALRRTLNYLFDDLLQQDGNLPAYHGFLWDRTRAIRRDFTFFSTLAPDELQIQVYVLENIARFHVTSLHLLSNAGAKPEGFSEQQEREQLGKTLLSLRDVYDDCNVQGIVCENETQFRAYYLIFHAMSPMIMETLQRTWKPELWRDSDEIRTAVSLVETLQSTSDFHGPLMDGPTMAVSGGYGAYFKIVEDPSISYTMACFAEIHFAQLRQNILRSVAKTLARPQGETTDVSAATLNSFLRFDTVTEAITFAENHGLEFKADPEAPNDRNRQILGLQRNQQLDQPKLFHKYSKKIVEKKRGNASLPEVLHRTTYPDPNAQQEPEEEEEGDVQRVTNGAVNTPAQNEAPKPSSFGQPAEAPKNPFASLGQQQAAPSGTKPNGVPASQLPHTNSPFGGFSSQPPPPKDSPFASAFKPTDDITAASISKPATSILGGLQSENTGAQDGPKNDPATMNQPTATAANPFANFFPKPSGEPSKANENGTSNENSQTSTTPQSSPPEPKKPTVSFSAAEPTSTAFPPTIATGTSTPSVLPNFASQKAPDASSGLLSFKPAAPSTGAPSLLPSAATPKVSEVGSSSGLAPSPFAPEPAGTGAPLFPLGNTQQSNPSPATSGVPTSNDLFKPRAPLLPPAPPKDLMGDFTTWFVTGDQGLMQDFEKHVLSQILGDMWTQFHKDEAERKIREEEEEIERQVEEFRVKNIQIKTFYKWKRTARELRLGKVRRQQRDDLRAWRVSEAQRKKEEAAKQAVVEKRKRKEAARAAEEDNKLSQFMQRKRLKRSRAEEDLIASGVLSGVTNEQEQARRITHRTHASLDLQRPSTSHSVASSTASTPRKLSGKVQKLREQFSEKKEGFRRSLPPGWSRNTSSPETKPRRSAASDRWRLKAMGLVEMPDGTALPEKMADEALYGNKKYPGLDNRPRSSSLATPSRRVLSNGSTSHPFKSSHLSRPSDAGTFQPPSPPNKRKRSSEDTPHIESSPNKRILSESEKLIQELRAMHEDLAEGRDWYTEQIEQYQSGSRGTTPWDESI